MAEAPSTVQQLILQAGQVFTPTAPIDQPALFSGRSEQIRLIVDVVNQRGQHAILYGEPGVGKTSLANVVSSFTAGGKGVLSPRVNCDDKDDFASVWRKLFQQIDESLTLTQTVSSMSLTSQTKTEEVSISALIGKDITPDAVRRALTMLGRTSLPVLVIDEFDRLPAHRRRAFADMIKTLSDHAVPATVILVGVADSVEQLLAEHQSVERPLMQIRMPRMSPSEIAEIINKGLTKLGMTIEPTALGRIAKLSQGLPHYAHLLGLYGSRAALDEDSRRIDVAAVDAAIQKATSGVQQSILSAYELAVRSARKNNLFSDVLLSCALAETTELGFFAAQDVRGPLRRITQTDYEIPTFAQHLNEFADPKRGTILVKTGSRRLYRYRFRNPLMQPYVIMQGLKNKRIVPDMLD
jgi:Holliday junction resolvasome RuvABC ATP-dependent DNA helicase subunit